MFKQEDF